LVAHANIAPAVGAHTMVAALLDQWFAGDEGNALYWLMAAVAEA
jgi:hypothetical protein